MLLQNTLPIYKNDVYLSKFGASAFASDIITRYLFSSVVPLFTVQMIDKLGFDWAMSLVAFITVVLLPIPWLIFRFGPRLRAKSSYVQG